MPTTDKKIDWNNITTADWLKVVAVIAAAGFILYRCLLPFRAEYAFREAYGYENQRNIPLTVEKYLKAIRLAPWETYYHTQLGRIYENEARAETDVAARLEKIRKAEEIYDECLRISPTNPWYVMRKAEVLGLYAELEFMTGEAVDQEKVQALQAQREALILRANELDPNNAIFTISAANLYLQKKEYDKAREKYEHVLVIDERMGDAYLNLGALYAQQGNTAKQEEMYRTALEKAPDYKNVRLALGQLYEQQGKLKEAIDLYKEEAYLDRSNENAFRVLGMAFFKDSQWVNMEIAFNRLTQLNPSNVDYYLFRAQAQIRQNKIQAAISGLEAAQELNPNNTNIRSNLQGLRGLNSNLGAPVPAPPPPAQPAREAPPVTPDAA